MGDINIFEQPLNERFRLMLRVERLFERIDAQLEQTGVWHTHAALQAMLELWQTVARGDSKREFIKELERQRTVLSRYDQHSTVDAHRLQAILTEHERLIDALHQGRGALGDEWRDNDLLVQLQQRATASGKPGMLELASYQEWLQRPAGERHETIRRWLEPMAPARAAIDHALKLVREAGEWQSCTAADGFFEQTLPGNATVRLLRLRFDRPDTHGCLPEISAGRQRFTIRFFSQTNPEQRATQIVDTTRFELACCGI